MTQRIFLAKAGEDDCFRIGTTFEPSKSWLRVGDSGGLTCELAIRLRGYTIPKGSTITTSFMRFWPNKAFRTKKVKARIYAEDAAHPQPIISYADFMFRPFVPGYVHFNDDHWRYSGQPWFTPDLTEIIQHLVNAYGIAEEGVHIFLKSEGSDENAFRDFYAWEAHAEPPPYLEITWIEPPTPPPQTLWALIDHYSWFDGAILWVRAITDRPCRLTMRYQQTGIVPHHRITVRRGVEDTRDPHLAFDNYLDRTQLETGDTTEHTFWIDGVFPCKTWYWMFVGTLGEKTSPSSSPVFHYHLPLGGWSEIIRPSAPGDLTEFPSVIPPLSPHWETVNEATLNEDDWCGKKYATYIAEPKTDLFHSTRLHTPETPIEGITLHSWWQGSGVGAYHYNWHVIKTYETVYESPQQEHINPGYFYRYYTWETNPFTGKPWTTQEINDLQFGEKIWIVNGGGAMELLQLYCEVAFQAVENPLL